MQLCEVCRRDSEQTEWNVWTFCEYDCVLFYTHKEFLYSDVNESAKMYYIYKLLLWCYYFCKFLFFYYYSGIKYRTKILYS